MPQKWVDNLKHKIVYQIVIGCMEGPILKILQGGPEYEVTPLVESLCKKSRSIMVFDDVMLEKQEPIEKYFTMGRHGGADCFYLTHNYFRIPKQAIRDNANLIVLFNQDVKNLRGIHDTFVGGDMPFDEFRKFFSECAAQPYGFAVIDLTSQVHDGKYRCGFDRFYNPMTCI